MSLRKAVDAYCLAELLNCVTVAIAAKDWAVDGACDPEMAIRACEEALREAGFVQNGISGEWQLDGKAGLVAAEFGQTV